MKLKAMNRLQAFGLHFLASLSIALISAVLVFLLWYPGKLATASGVGDIFLLLLFVDVSLGPVITLVVFDPAKKELKRDLAIVALVQIAALTYGLHTVFIARPVYMVFNVDRFDLVYANDLTKEKLERVNNPKYRSLPLFGTETVAAHPPQDAKAQTKLLFSSLSGGDDLPQMPEYYTDYAAQKANVTKRALPLGVLRDLNRDRIAAMESLIKRYAAEKINIGYLPLKGKATDMAVIVNRDTGDILDVADLRPWR